MIAAELAQRRLVQLKQDFAQLLGRGITGGKTLSVNLAVPMRVLPCLWLISPSWLRWRLSRPALLMLLSVVPASDSILPPGPNGNLALQPGHQSRVYRTILYALACFRSGAAADFGLRRCNARIPAVRHHRVPAARYSAASVSFHRTGAARAGGTLSNNPVGLGAFASVCPKQQGGAALMFGRGIAGSLPNF